MVADEAHVYSGIFGSNVHYIIKRLKRLSNKIQFVAASATLDNAVEFCEKLFGVKDETNSWFWKQKRNRFCNVIPIIKNSKSIDG